MSKFQPRESFDKKPGDYQLLPFSFTQLENNSYILTNLAGEFVVADRSVLGAMIRHELPRFHVLYDDLLSKHFIVTHDSKVGLDLLALKLRTKTASLADFTSLHMFVVSLRCEHSCPYCQVSRQSDDRVAFDMSEATADKALSLVFRSPSPNIKIEFQGGEPLLNFDLVQYIVAKAKLLNQSHERNLQFVIATNLALINDDILRYCRSHDVLISTSLDGPADLHNKNRPRPGRDSYERAVAGIHKARSALGKDRVSALMTTTEASLTRAKDIIDEYLQLGFDGIFLRPLSPYGFAVKTKSYAAYGIKRWLDFYFEGLDYIIEINKAGHRFVEYYSATILQKMLTPFGTRYVDLMSPAGIGIAALVYNYDGDVYASDESRMLAEMGDKSFRLGNVYNDSYEKLMLSDALLEPLEQSFAPSVPMCSECAFEPFCGSEPVFHHATQNDYIGKKPSSAFCQRNMAIFRKLVKLMETDTSAKQIFHSWAA